MNKPRRRSARLSVAVMMTAAAALLSACTGPSTAGATNSAPRRTSAHAAATSHPVATSTRKPAPKPTSTQHFGPLPRPDNPVLYSMPPQPSPGISGSTENPCAECNQFYMLHQECLIQYTALPIQVHLAVWIQIGREAGFVSVGGWRVLDVWLAGPKPDNILDKKNGVYYRVEVQMPAGYNPPTKTYELYHIGKRSHVYTSNGSKWLYDEYSGVMMPPSTPMTKGGRYPAFPPYVLSPAQSKATQDFLGVPITFEAPPHDCVIQGGDIAPGLTQPLQPPSDFFINNNSSLVSTKPYYP